MRSPARPACTCRAKAAFVDRRVEREPSATCSSTTPPTSICSSTRRCKLMASAKTLQARLVVPARQGRAAVRRRRAGTRPAGTRAPTRTTCRSARSPPASRRTSNTRAPSMPPPAPSGSRGAPFVGEARVDLVDAAIRHKLASGRTDVITFGSGFVTLQGAKPRSDECASCGSTPRSAASSPDACAPIAVTSRHR